jgi:TonB family protein
MISTNARSFLLAALVAAICNPLHAADSQIRVVPESGLNEWWQAPSPNHNLPPQYPIDAIKSGVEGCMAVAFEIQRDGSVSNERLWSNKTPKFRETKAWEQATLLAVHQWRYVPAPANTSRDPVYTYAVVTFTLSNGEKWTEYDKERNESNKAKCEMTDFPQQVQAMINSAQAGKKP